MKANEIKSNLPESTQKTMADLKEAGREALETGRHLMEGFGGDYGKKMQEGFDTVKAKVKSGSSDVHQWVQRNPLAAVGIALGAGLLLGKALVSTRKE